MDFFVPLVDSVSDFFAWCSGILCQLLPEGNVTAYVSGLLTFLVPLALLLFQPNGSELDRNVILRYVVKMKWFLISSMLLIFSVLIWNFSLHALVCLGFLFLLAGSIIYLLLLVRVYRWLIQRKTDMSSNSYANRLRIKYLHDISSDQDAADDTWSRLLEWKEGEQFMYPGTLMHEFFEIYNGANTKEPVDQGPDGMEGSRGIEFSSANPQRKDEDYIDLTEHMLIKLRSKLNRMPEQAYAAVLKGIIPLFSCETTDDSICRVADSIFSNLVCATKAEKYSAHSLFKLLDQKMDVAGPDGRRLFEERDMDLLYGFKDNSQARGFVMYFPEKWKQSGQDDDPMQGDVVRCFQDVLSTYDANSDEPDSPIATSVAEQLFPGTDIKTLAVLLRFVSAYERYSFLGPGRMTMTDAFVCQRKVFGENSSAPIGYTREEAIWKSLSIMREGWPRIFAEPVELEKYIQDIKEGIGRYNSQPTQATELKTLENLLDAQLKIIKHE